MRRKEKLMNGKQRMWKRMAAVALAVGMMVAVAGAARADDKEIKIDKSLDNLKFGILAYLDYSSGETPLPKVQGSEANFNQFALTRGYITLEKKFLPNLGARVTLDITGLNGSYFTRIKYLYAVIQPNDLGPFTNMKAELGMGHIPWLDFEEHINPFRCQGTMAIERAGTFASADDGVSLMGNIGGKLEDAKGKTGNGAYDGKYGSWHIGVYNGSGYGATENNQNKTFEGRISLRPLPDAAPGLQISYFYLTGDGNTKYTLKHDDFWSPYQVQIGMFSFEHPAVTFTAQYMATKGDAKGDWVYATHKNPANALPTVGQSYFLNVKIPGTDGKLSILGRYDIFDMDPENKIIKKGDTSYQMTIYGVAYDIYKGNMIVVDYESTNYDKNSAGKGKVPVMNTKLGNDDKVQVVYQVNL